MYLKEEMKLIKKVFVNVRALFSGFEILYHLLFLFITNFGFFYLISKEIYTSVAIGVVGMLFFFFVYTYPNNKLRKYQNDLKELMKYVTNMIFYLKTGENVYYALERTKRTLSGDIQKEINKTIESMENRAVIDTEHFRKYKFPALDQFHHNLQIKYEHGGDAEELFGSILRNMMFELKKRDELYKKRTTFALNVYVLLGLVSLIPLILRFLVSELWDTFLNYGITSIIILIITYGLMLLNLYLLQRKKLDISVTL